MLSFGQAVDYVKSRIDDRLSSGAPNRKEEENKDTSILETFEKPLLALQSLMFWENPNHTVLFLASFHFSFWFLIWSRRILSIIFTAVFLLSFLTVWKTRIWPEIRVPPSEDQLEREAWICLHPHILTIPEIVHLSSRIMHSIQSAVKFLLLMRSEKPGVFCVALTLLFSLTALVGQMISGALIVYTILMAFFLAPALLYLITGSSLRRFLAVDAQDGNDQFLGEDLVPKSEFFDIFSASRQERTSYSLDRELGILASEAEGSSSSSSSSMRIVSSHFSGNQSSSSEREKGDSDDGTDEGSCVMEESFEMISDEEVRGSGPLHD